MDNHKHLPDKIFNLLNSVIENNNLEAYVIGGYVRDYFLKRECKDIDIVVVGSGIELAEKLGAKLDSKVTVFKQFGTAMLRYKDIELEFVGARKESYRVDSRNPIVEDGTIKDDQNRRDFTINAMAFGLNNHNFGDLIDPFDGMEDLRNGIIKTPLDPDKTFSDDPLRMVRAIRFATQLDFEIEEETFSSIQRNNQRIEIITKERINTELEKIIASKTPSIGFKLFEQCGLLQYIFPELEQLKGTQSVNGRSHKDNFYHTLQVLDNVAQKSDNIDLRWAAIMHDIAKPRTKAWDVKVGWTFHAHEVIGSKMVPSIFKKMKMPLNNRMRYIQKLVFLHLRPISLTEDIVTDSAVRRLLFEAGDDIDDLMLLCMCDITSKNDDKVNRYMKNFKLVSQKLKEIEEKDRVRNFQPPITGEVIMKRYNIEPCNEIGQIKTRIKEAILEGIIPNEYESAYEMMEKIAIEIGLDKKNSSKENQCSE